MGFRYAAVLMIGMAGCRNRPLVTAVCPAMEATPKAPQSSEMREAFEHHWPYRLEVYRDLQDRWDTRFGAGAYKQLVWENYQKSAVGCPSLAEVVKVRIDKTQDTGTYVIELFGPHAKDFLGFDDRCSLWLRGAGIDKEIEVDSFMGIPTKDRP